MNDAQELMWFTIYGPKRPFTCMGAAWFQITSQAGHQVRAHLASWFWQRMGQWSALLKLCNRAHNQKKMLVSRW